MKSNKIEVNR